MVKSCCAWRCTNRYQKRKPHGSEDREKEVTFFSFPMKNQELTKRWIAALRRDKFTPTAYRYICRVDFRDHGLRRRLKKDAIPSVFDFPDHLQTKTTQRRTLIRKGTNQVKKRKD